MHIGTNNKSMVTLLQFSLSKEMRKEAKPQGENPPSRKDIKRNTKNVEMLVLLLLQTNADVWRNLLLGKKINLLTWIKSINNCKMDTKTM